MYAYAGAAGEGRQWAEGAAAQQHAQRHLAHVPPLLQNYRHAHYATYIQTDSQTFTLVILVMSYIHIGPPCGLTPIAEIYKHHIIDLGSEKISQRQSRFNYNQ